MGFEVVYYFPLKRLSLVRIAWMLNPLTDCLVNMINVVSFIFFFSHDRTCLGTFAKGDISLN